MFGARVEMCVWCMCGDVCLVIVWRCVFGACVETCVGVLHK